MMVAPENYQDKEFEIPKKIIEEAGHQVIVGSKYKGKATGKLGGSVEVEVTLREVVVDQYDGIIFVGGPGAACYVDDDEAHQLVRLASSIGKAVGAICIAPTILANAGILSGVKISIFPSEEDNARSKGAEIISADVTVDRNIVTGSGPYAAEEFGHRFLEALNNY